MAIVAAALAACAPYATSTAMSTTALLRTKPTPRPAVATTHWTPCLSSAAYADLQGPVPASPWPLRGNPAFDPADLPEEARRWYDRLWDAISDPDRSRSMTALAARDDLYHYSRALHTYVLSLLAAFRATGDLALLDEVDRLAEHMRARLRDPWRGTLDRTDGTTDGYVNWVFRYGNSRDHQGKDLHTFDEMRTHAMVAEVTWALHHNRDLTSPNGIDYGQHADNWIAYLQDHFEAKWRERNEVPEGAFPFLESTSMHATVAFVKYHHYMARITGQAGHLREAERLASIVFDHFATVSHAGETALVWPRTLTDQGGTQNFLQPTTYARYVFGDLVDLHLDGFTRVSSSTVRAIAHTVRSFVLVGPDTNPSLARDIGGGVARAGIPASAASAWSPPTLGQHTVSPTSFVALWDRSGRVAVTACVVETEAPASLRSAHLPAAMLLALARR